MRKGLVSITLAAAYVLGMAVSAGAAPARSLAEVIEGAKKEGKVAVRLVHGFKEKSMNRLEKEIREKFGVDLKINYTGETKMTETVAQAIMEDKTGAVPPYDMLSLSNHIAMANENGILEQVDWKPLLIQGTNPEAVNDNPLMRGSLVYTTAHFGIMYNADKVKPDEVPRTMADLADPKWKNKVGIETGGGSSVRWAFVLGKDKMIATYRDILKNGAITSRATTQYNRFLIGEIWFTRLSSTFLGTARKQGVRAEWQSLDFSDITEFAAVVRKGARNPNAAKLVALYLASPEGVKFGSEENGYGSMYYPGNYEHDIRLQDQKQGIPEIFTCRKTDILEFYTSKEGRSWGKEIGLILQTGGGGKAKKKK